MSDVRCLSSDVRCPLCDIRCAMSNVCCLMSDVRCQVYTFSLFLWLQVLGPLAGNTLFTEDDFKLLESFDMDLYARKVRDQVCFIFSHYNWGLHLQAHSVRHAPSSVFSEDLFSTSDFVLLYYYKCIIKGIYKKQKTKMFLVRISIKKRVGGRIFFPYLRFLIVTNWMLSLQIVTPPPPPGIS